MQNSITRMTSTQQDGSDEKPGAMCSSTSEASAPDARRNTIVGMKRRVDKCVWTRARNNARNVPKCVCSVHARVPSVQLGKGISLRVSGEQLTCTLCSGPETRVRVGLPFRHQAQWGCERSRWQSTRQSAIVRVPFCCAWFRPFDCEIVSTRTVLVEVFGEPRLTRSATRRSY